MNTVVNKANLKTQVTVCVSGIRNVRFFGKLGVQCFLVISVLRFAVLPFTEDIYSKCYTGGYPFISHSKESSSAKNLENSDIREVAVVLT